MTQQRGTQRIVVGRAAGGKRDLVVFLFLCLMHRRVLRDGYSSVALCRQKRFT